MKILVPPRGKTNQEVSTPPEFIKAVEARFGKIDLDLAANASNHVAPRYLGPGGLAEDALAYNHWGSLNTGGLAYLNPPFAKVLPWAYRATTSRKNGLRVALLIPAAVCTDWFLEWVQPNAYVFLLTPRVFAREVRDCALCIYEPAGYRGMEPWEWKDG